MSAHSHEDEDIRLFREEFPDVYDFVLKVITGKYDDQTLQVFEDENGKDCLNDFLRILTRKASSKDIEAFDEEYPNIYGAIRKMADGEPHWADETSDIEDWFKDIEQRRNRKARQIRFYRGLDEQAPGWELTNKKPDFVIWLNKKNVNTGKRNIDLIRGAYENYDSKTVAFFYNYFRQNSFSKKIQLEAYDSESSYKKDDIIAQKYEIFDILGEGGFGIVYLVYSHETEAVYALKTFRHEYLEDIQIRERFRKEAQIWIYIDWHPHIVQAHLVDDISGRLYIAMEYIAPNEQGLTTLDAYLRRQPPDLEQSLIWAIQFCHGMEYAYSKGIKAHRDIKPANIMIGQDNTVKISDFGLAGVIKLTKSSSEVKPRTLGNSSGETYQTMEGTAFGTPPYMPPEQFENAAGCDERSDIYSFGIVLYQMVSGGKLPFFLDMTEIKVNNVFRDWYKLHCEMAIPKLKSPLFSVIQRCLEKNPRERYQTFERLRADIEPLLERLTGKLFELPNTIESYSWDNRNKAASLERLGRHEDAFSYYDQWLKMFPFDKGIIFRKAVCLSNLKRYEEAIQCCDNIIKSDSENINAWNNKGLCLEKLGHHEEAMKCFKRGLWIDPADTSLLISIGNSFYKQCKYGEALSFYNRVLEINNQNAAAWRNKGLCHYALKDLNEAANCFQKAIDIDSLYEDAWFDQGVIFHELMDSKNAIRCYDRVLQITPKRIAAWINKGKCLYLLGSLFEAIDCYNEALEIDPANVTAWYEKGLFEDKYGRYLDALSSYQKFIELASTQDHGKIEFVLKRIQKLSNRRDVRDQEE